jgi:hypothetical protein
LSETRYANQAQPFIIAKRLQFYAGQACPKAFELCQTVDYKALLLTRVKSIADNISWTRINTDAHRSKRIFQKLNYLLKSALIGEDLCPIDKTESIPIDFLRDRQRKLKN